MIRTERLGLRLIGAPCFPLLHGNRYNQAYFRIFLSFIGSFCYPLRALLPSVFLRLFRCARFFAPVLGRQGMPCLYGDINKILFLSEYLYCAPCHLNMKF